MLGNAFFQHLSGRLDLRHQFRVLDTPLHEHQLRLIIPAVDEKVVDPLSIIADTLAPAPGFEGSEGQLRTHFPVNRADLLFTDVHLMIQSHIRSSLS